MIKSFTALKELNMWATNGYTACEPEKADELVNIIEKELEALVIISRFRHYNKACLDYLLSEDKINQHEYDLLFDIFLAYDFQD